jgi:probable HAF family extracellular repeat protein
MRFRFLLVLSAAVLASESHASFGFQILTPLQNRDPEAEVFGLSPDGSTPVGFSADPSNRDGAAYWTSPGSPHELDFADGANAAVAFAASNGGAVIVGELSSSSAGFDVEPFMHTAAGTVGLGFLPNALGYGYATAVSADGKTVVGTDDTKSGTEGFVWTAGQGLVGVGYLDPKIASSTAVGVSADGSVIAGSSFNSTGYTEAFTYSNGAMTGIGMLQNAMSSQAFALSENGKVVVGSSYINGNTTEAFAWSKATGMRALGYLPGDDPAKIRLFSEADAVSEDGTTIVGQGYDLKSQEALIWQRDGKIMALSSLLEQNGVNLQGATLWDAVGVSADGSVIDGWGRDANGRLISWIAQVTPQAVPEPASILTFFVGCAAIGRRRRAVRRS